MSTISTNCFIMFLSQFETVGHFVFFYIHMFCFLSKHNRYMQMHRKTYTHLE
jgi:hypothetical protein